jgi:drug/metabolite transporter, DME family
LIGILLGLAGAAGFGANSVLVRAGLPGVRMSVGQLMSLASSLVVVAGAAVFVDWSGVAGINPSTLAWFSMTGLVAFALGRRMDFEGIQRAGAARAAPIVAASPIFAIFFAVVFTAETVTVPLMAGVLLIVGGIAVVISSDPMIGRGQRGRVTEDGLRPWLGYGFALVAGMSYGLNNVLIRQGLRGFPHPLTGASIALASATLLLLLLSWSKLRDNARDRGRGLITLIVAGLASGIGVACSYLALSVAPVSVVSPLLATFPLWTLLGVRFFLARKEKVTWQMMAGAATVVIGVSVIAVTRI